MTCRTVLRERACAALCALALGGCGAAGRPGRLDPAAATLSPRALASLSNYRARLSSGAGPYRMTIRTQVHSPENWAAESGLTVLHIGPTSYVRFGQQWFPHPDAPQTYAQNNLPAFARQFFAMTRVSGARVRRGPPCRQAGLAGYTWTVSASGGTSFGAKLIACVADASGALLKLAVTASSTAMAGQYASEVYEITAVGGVAPFQVPVNSARS